MSNFLPTELHFIKNEEVWAFIDNTDSGHRALLNRISGNGIERVSLRHAFRNLSNTTDFYYQQRFNSADSEDALTVKEYLHQSQQSIAEPVSKVDAVKQVSPYSAVWSYDRVVEKFQLQPLLNEQIIKLSNGETKRLLIGAAMIKNPRVLLLDHPLTGLDTATRLRFNDLISEVLASGVLVIISTSASEIPTWVTHLAVIQKGNWLFRGSRLNFNPQQLGLVSDVQIDVPALQSILENQEATRFDTIVHMNAVTVRYDKRVILDSINWLVRQGERWALTGPNGAGKSTLLSLINGDNPQAYANDIVLFDRKRGSGESIWDIKKHTGFVSPELYQYFPTESSCLHVVESGFYDTVGLFRRSDPEKERRCLKWMKMMGIEQWSSRLFSTVPTSTQRLCLLARALVKSPALLILDEPTQGLDAHQQVFFTRLVDLICSFTDVTLIYVSHYKEHIPQAVTLSLNLENGRVTGLRVDPQINTVP